MTLNWNGVIIGVAAFLIIGIFHPVVIKCEYYFGERVWPVFLVLGLLSGGASLLVEDGVLSGILGILSCVLLWCIRELKEQTRRVEQGWFPKNPNRK
ncbi:MAG: DUF4491 family protein [Synergistaceae bacterium]|nr:DUF4491 family protein [Synergistaceae bacterium]